MLRSAIIVVITSASAAILGIRCADAMVISAATLYYFQSSDKCSSKWDSDQAFDYGQVLGRDWSAAHIGTCRPDLSSGPAETADTYSNDPLEGFDGQLYEIADHSEIDDMKRGFLPEELDPDRALVGADSCIYLERDHQVLRAEEDAHCGIFEPGVDLTELLGVVTLAIVAILVFAVVPLAWLLTRYFRAWRLGGSAFATSGASALRVRTMQTHSPALVRVRRHRLSSSEVRHRHGRRRSRRAD